MEYQYGKCNPITKVGIQYWLPMFYQSFPNKTPQKYQPWNPYVFSCELLSRSSKHCLLVPVLSHMAISLTDFRSWRAGDMAAQNFKKEDWENGDTKLGQNWHKNFQACDVVMQ